MTGISTFGQSLTQVERLKVLQTQLADFQRQLSSGKKSELFEGLGTDVLTSKRARASFSQLDTYVNNIKIATRRTNLMISTMEEVKAQAGILFDTISGQPEQGDIDMDSINTLASNIRSFLTNLINTKDGDRFLFAGADALSPPIADTGALDTHLQGQLANWLVPPPAAANIDTDTLISNYRDNTFLTDPIIGFSPSLSSGNTKDIFVRVDESAELRISTLGNEDHFRDIIAVAAMVENLTGVLDKVAIDPSDPLGTVTAPGTTHADQNDNFFQLFNDLAGLMAGALDELDDELFEVGRVQAQMGTALQNHELQQNVLQGQIADVENIDINEVAVGLNALQTQLEASFRVTAAIRQLSLVNFI